MISSLLTLCAGGEGVGSGAKMAGIKEVVGLEIDPQLAQVAIDNGFDVRVADITQVDPAEFIGFEGLHASPPCKSYSINNQQTNETPEDIAIGQAVARFIQKVRPRLFTLENVTPYLHGKAWKHIQEALVQTGYIPDVARVNAADFGVPQIRRRLVVRAIYCSLIPPLPQSQPWIGWLSAIEDILSTLPESLFADWQIKKLNQAIGHSFLLSGANTTSAKPIPPANPSGAVGNVERIGNLPRAWLVGDQRGQLCDEKRPAFTVTANENGGTSPRAWLEQGRVVKMTPRAMARFQSFPDSYKLPGKASLAVKVIGNAVPPLLYKGILQSMGV